MVTSETVRDYSIFYHEVDKSKRNNNVLDAVFGGEKKKRETIYDIVFDDGQL